MTGILIAFTGWMLPYVIQEQTGGTCVAHGVANVATIAGYNVNAQQIIDKLNIGFTGGYQPHLLPQTLSEYGIGSLKKMTKEELTLELRRAPVIGTVFDEGVTISNVNIKRHTFAILGKSETGSRIGNSWGTGFGWSGYGIMPDTEINNMWFQTIGSGAISPSYIVIERKLSKREIIEKRESLKKLKESERKRRIQQSLESYRKSK